MVADEVRGAGSADSFRMSGPLHLGRVLGTFEVL